MGRKRENQNPIRIWEQEHFSMGIMAGNRCSGRQSRLCCATGAPVPAAERWHIFEVRKQSFQQLERHAKINPRFLADPFPSATVPARQTPARGSAGGNSPANSLCMGEIPSATEVIISQQEPTISFHLGTNSNNVRRPGEEGHSLLRSL